MKTAGGSRNNNPMGRLSNRPPKNGRWQVVGTARAYESLRTACECCRPFEEELPKIINRADVLLANLTELQHTLFDLAMRERLAKSHAEAVTYAGEVAPSYVEAIYRAGERLYETINVLCRCGVLYPSQTACILRSQQNLPSRCRRFRGSRKSISTSLHT